MPEDHGSKLVESQAMLSEIGKMEQSSDVGSELRMARARLGWQLPDVAAALRIRLPYLEALEQGRMSDLPGTAYALGFLRTYAAALGLDADALARRFKAEAGDINQKPELTFPVPVPRRGVPAGAVVLLGVVLAIGAYIGWYRLSGEGKLPAEAVALIPERLAPLAEQAIQTPPPPAPARPAHPPDAPPPAALAVAPAETPAAPSDVAGRLPSVPPSSAAAMAVPPSQAPVSMAVPAAPPASPVAAATAAIPGQDDSRIILRARSDAWMQVRDHASGQILLNRVLKAGETWPVPAKSALLLTTGNAGGTELVVDGLTAPAIGNSGAVRRDLPLDPDLIKEGKLPAQMQAANQAQPAHPASSSPPSPR